MYLINYTLKLFEIALYYNQALHPNYSEPVTPLKILKKSEQLKPIQPDFFQTTESTKTRKKSKCPLDQKT